MSDANAVGFAPESLPELQRLKKALLLADGFVFLVVETDAPRTVLELMAWLRMELESEHNQLVPVRRFSPDRDHTGRVQFAPTSKSLTEWLDEQRIRSGLSVRAIDASSARSDDADTWTQLFRRLNERRNDIARDLPCALLLFLSPVLVPVFPEAAPDFWSYRSGLITIRSNWAGREIRIPREARGPLKSNPLWEKDLQRLTSLAHSTHQSMDLAAVGSQLRDLRRFDEALEMLERAYQLALTEPTVSKVEIEVRIAKTAFQAGQLEFARQRAQHALDTLSAASTPISARRKRIEARAKLWLGAALNLLGRAAEAQRVLQSVIDNLQTHEPLDFVIFVQVLCALGQLSSLDPHRRAVALAAEGKARFPGNLPLQQVYFEALCELGETLAQCGEVEEAVEVLRATVRDAEQHANDLVESVVVVERAQQLLALLYDTLGDPERARFAKQRADELYEQAFETPSDSKSELLSDLS